MITVSLVVYNSSVDDVSKLVKALIVEKLITYIFIINNNPADDQFFPSLPADIQHSEKVKFIQNKSNAGYGQGHNLGIEKADQKYHLVINPDIDLPENTLNELVKFMESDPGIVQCMPKVLSHNGDNQNLCKLLPKPSDLFFRRLAQGKFRSEIANNRFTLSDYKYDFILDVPNLSGCCMLFRTEALKKVNGFDTRYFMYMEDVDLTRRMGSLGRTVCYPFAHVYHGYAKSSYRNWSSTINHTRSAIKYFNKWGWIIDFKRRNANQKCLSIIAQVKDKNRIK